MMIEFDSNNTQPKAQRHKNKTKVSQYVTVNTDTVGFLNFLSKKKYILLKPLSPIRCLFYISMLNRTLAWDEVWRCVFSTSHISSECVLRSSGGFYLVLPLCSA